MCRICTAAERFRLRAPDRGAAREAESAGGTAGRASAIRRGKRRDQRESASASVALAGAKDFPAPATSICFYLREDFSEVTAFSRASGETAYRLISTRRGQSKRPSAPTRWRAAGGLAAANPFPGLVRRSGRAVRSMAPIPPARPALSSCLRSAARMPSASFRRWLHAVLVASVSCAAGGRKDQPAIPTSQHQRRFPLLAENYGSAPSAQALRGDKALEGMQPRARHYAASPV